MKACGICGSDARYFQGHNPWSLHTLGRNIPSPPNMVLGHEVAGVVETDAGTRRVAILAYKGCGVCAYCVAGQENLCGTMQHFGHSAGWPQMAYYPGGMAEEFEIWKGFEYDIPDTITFEEATFLDGLAVAIHANTQAAVGPSASVGCIGLGPIGLMAAQVASAKGAERVIGCDTDSLPVMLAKEVGVKDVVHGNADTLVNLIQSHSHASDGLDAVIDTVGTEESVLAGLALLRKSGTLTLLAVHEHPIRVPPVALSGERRIVTSANNMYADFPEAIHMLAEGSIKVAPLITHRFPLAEASKAFEVMLNKEASGAYKIVLHP